MNQKLWIWFAYFLVKSSKVNTLQLTYKLQVFNEAEHYQKILLFIYFVANIQRPKNISLATEFLPELIASIFLFTAAAVFVFIFNITDNKLDSSTVDSSAGGNSSR